MSVESCLTFRGGLTSSLLWRGELKESCSCPFTSADFLFLRDFDSLRGGLRSSLEGALFILFVSSESSLFLRGGLMSGESRLFLRGGLMSGESRLFLRGGLISGEPCLTFRGGLTSSLLRRGELKESCSRPFTSDDFFFLRDFDSLRGGLRSSLEGALFESSLLFRGGLMSGESCLFLRGGLMSGESCLFLRGGLMSGESCLFLRGGLMSGKSCLGGLMSVELGLEGDKLGDRSSF